MKIKDVFGYGNITLTGTNGGVVNLNPNNIVYLQQEDTHTKIGLSMGGNFCVILEVKQTPGRIKQKSNNLAAKQDKYHKQMEEEAKIEAQQNFFDKYPKTKAMFQAECAELGQKCDLKK